MTDDRFWQIIGESLDESHERYGQERFGRIAFGLPSFVRSLEDQELLEFCQLYEQKDDEVYDGVFWAALTLVNLTVNNFGISDDCFMDIRDCLVAQGRECYERFVKDPDSLVEYQEPLAFDEEYIGSSCRNALVERGIPEPERSPLELRRPVPDWDDIGFFRAYLPKIYQFVSIHDPEFWLRQTKSY